MEAGNLYVNRPTTGAIVGRQPFGGWKRSSVGPTAKTGGPNYLLALRRWRDAHETSVDDAAADYRRWWDAHFGRVTDLAGLSCESNQLRYRPFVPGVIVRVTEDGSDDEVAKALRAAAVTGTPVRVSLPRRRPRWRRKSEATLTVESAEALAASLADGSTAPACGSWARPNPRFWPPPPPTPSPSSTSPCAPMDGSSSSGGCASRW